MSPASVNDSYMIKDVVPQEFSPLDRTLVGGKRRRRRMRGGSGRVSFRLDEPGSANWSGDGNSGAGITNFGSGSTGLQIEAGMSGGRSRRRKHRRRSHRGGTISHRSEISPSPVEQRALLA